MRYRYEFSSDIFIIGNCAVCPLIYIDTDFYGDYVERCGLGSDQNDCPLEEVKKGYWYTDGETKCCSVCKLPWNYCMRENGDDWGYFDPMPKFCPHCGAEMKR